MDKQGYEFAQRMIAGGAKLQKKALKQIAAYERRQEVREAARDEMIWHRFIDRMNWIGALIPEPITEN